MKPTRATLASDPYRAAKDERWRAAAHVVNTGLVILILGDDHKNLKRGSQVNARYEAGEWRVG